MAVTSHSPLDPEYVAANREVVERVLGLLGETRLLGPSGTTDPVTCCREAGRVRDLLNTEIPNVRRGGVVDAGFKRMRSSARDFVRAAGPGQGAFRGDTWYFHSCLQAMRLTLDDEVAGLSSGFGVTAPGA